MLLVTGGAGFIGSNVVAALNDAGRADVAVCDVLGHDGKWRNLAKRQLADFVPPAELADWLQGRRLDAVIHLGAISETTATDGDLVIETNFRLSMRLLDWCTANATPFIYASSAATYGDGAQGFADDPSLPALKPLRPMNLYGWSKHLFDLAVAERAANGERLPPQWAGLKFFNVFGPNEYHKGTMMSVLARRFDDIKAGRVVQLFKSHRDGIADGDQRRDFIYVDDVVRVMMWLLATPIVSGIFNVGTGTARSFKDLILVGLCRARHICEYRVYRYARANSRQLPVLHPKRGRSAAARRLQWWFHRAGRCGRGLRQGFSRFRRSLPLTRNRVRVQMFDFEALSDAIASQTVLCVGDLMLDEFVYGEVSRISPEAPAPVIAVQRSETNIGGAGNVARNIAALGARCIFVGLIGEDDAGAALKSALAQESRIESVLVSDPARGRRRERCVSFPNISPPTCCARTGNWRSRPPPRSSRN